LIGLSGASSLRACGPTERCVTRSQPRPYPFLDRVTDILEPFQPKSENAHSISLDNVEKGTPANDNALEVVTVHVGS
jgi:hypothetical protein